LANKKLDLRRINTDNSLKEAKAAVVKGRALLNKTMHNPEIMIKDAAGIIKMFAKTVTGEKILK